VLVLGVDSGGLVEGNFIPTPPLSHLYIRGDGSVDPPTPLLTVSGEVYTFTGDFTNTTIIIERDEVTLDGAGYSITGHSTNADEGVSIVGRTNVTVKNLVINSFGVGISMDNALNNTLCGNKMSSFAAFMMANSNDNIIVNNNVTEGYGIYGSGSNNLISNNSFCGSLAVSGGGMGIYLGGNNNTISYNTVIHGVCINLCCQNSTISNNTVLNGFSGILLCASSNNLVFGNIVKNITTEYSSLTTHSLYISRDSTNNIIYENTFENNTLAVALGAQVAHIVWNNVSDNFLFRNNFINNTQNVWIAPGAPINYWDDGTQGNYWSDFQGVDSNGDGISETPYVITSNNTDYHPLMAPFDVHVSPSTSQSPSPSAVPYNASPQSTNSPTTNAIQQSTPPPEVQIPEFPTWTLLPLGLLTLSIVCIISGKNKSKR
jgi:parallel beta-helix repeat protein